MKYTLPRLLSLLITIFFIVACNQNNVRENEATNQTNTDQSTENEENPKTSEAPSTTKPLQGTVNGEPFQLDEASLDGDILTLRQGEEFHPELSVTLFLFAENSSQPPVNERFRAKSEGEITSADTPHLHMHWKPKDSEDIGANSIVCGCNLDLKFGEKQGDDVLPATLNLQSEKFGINLSGSLEVEIEE